MNFILKVTYRCNLRCEYCYEAGREHSENLSLQNGIFILRRIRDFLKQTCGKSPVPVFLGWHGGEPFTRNADFFRDLLAESDRLFARSPYAVQHTFQTNALLIAPRHLPILKRPDVSVSVSLDIGSQYRVFPDGRDANEDILSRIQFLRRHGIVPGIYCVITRQNVGKADEIYDFFRRQKLMFMVMPVDASGVHRLKRLRPPPRLYGALLVALAGRWLDDDDPRTVFHNGFISAANLLGGVKGACACWQVKNCVASTVTIAPNGDVSHCDMFPGDEFVFGNLLESPLAEILRSRRRRLLAARFNRMGGSCRGCRWLRNCWGGCPGHRVDFFLKDYYCSAIKSLYGYLDSRREDVEAKGAAIADIQRRLLSRKEIM